MSTTLQALLEQSENERDAALARVQQADEALRQGQAQAEQLHAYREDYRRRAPALNGKGASIELVRCHQGFMQRLDQAIEHQKAQVVAIEKHAAVLRDQLLERELRVASVKKLLERRADEAMRREARADQRRTDEHAQRATWGRTDVFASYSHTQH